MAYTVADFEADLQSLRRRELLTQFSVPSFAANVWTSAWVDAENYALLTIFLGVNQNIAANGVTVDCSPQGSSSNAAAIKSTQLTSSAGQSLQLSTQNLSRYFRVKVTHNGVAPTVFECNVLGETNRFS